MNYTYEVSPVWCDDHHKTVWKVKRWRCVPDMAKLVIEYMSSNATWDDNAKYHAEFDCSRDAFVCLVRMGQ